MSKIKYKYKLNDNYNPDRRVKRDSASIMGIVLSNKKYKAFDEEQSKLKPFLRTDINKDGVVDFVFVDESVKEDTVSKEESVIEDAQTVVDPESKVFCTKEELESMDRVAVEEVAETFDIEFTDVETEALIKKILKVQKEFINS